MLTKMVNGESVVLSAEEETEIRARWAQADIDSVKEKENAYLSQRLIAYPSVQDQLLNIWASMDAGEIPVAKAFYELIKTVNDQFPAPKA